MLGGRAAGRLTRVGLALIATVVVVTTSFTGSAMAQDSSATPSTGASSSGGETTFTYADVSEPSSLNPLVGYLGTDYILWAMTYDLPINFSANDFSPDFQHSITTSVDTSSDGLNFTYHIRPNMKWSDGQPFTAEDVAWTLNYYKVHNTSNYSSDLVLMDHATATNATTMVLTASKPTSLYSGKTVFMYEYILPEHIWSKYDCKCAPGSATDVADYKKAKQDPVLGQDPSTGGTVGSGPFIMQQYQKSQFVSLTKNPTYWGNSVGLTPHVDKVVYKIFGNQDAEAAALRNGEIDFGYFTSANILNTLKGQGLNTRGAQVPSFGEVGINTGSAYQKADTTTGFKPHGDGAHALTDVVVRQAIRRAVDNKVLVDKVLLGYGTPGISPVQPDATTGAWTPGPNDPDLSFNLTAANQMLDSAGYKLQDPSSPPSESNLRVDPVNNKTLDFRFYSRSSDQPSQDIVPYISDWLNQIGIKIEPQTITSGKLGNIILDGNYDLFEWGWYPNPDPNYILDVFSCAQRPPGDGTYLNSDSYYCNPDYDKLNDEQHTVTDATQRADVVHQMQAILYRDEPYVVLWNDQVLEAWTNKFTGYVSQPGNDRGDALATYGPYSFISIRAASAGGTGGTGGSSSSGGIPAWVWIAIAGVILAIIVVVVVSRGRRDDENIA
jgi:peptide/nickel transport system substrate-binding protein